MTKKTNGDTVTVSGIILTRAVIRRGLGQIDNPMALAASPLAELRVVARQLLDMGIAASAAPDDIAPRDRGRALQQVLKDALSALRPGAGDMQPAEPAWRWYAALHMQFVLGRNYNYVAQQLGMSTAAFYRLAAEAIDMLIDGLCTMERACVAAMGGQAFADKLEVPAHLLIGAAEEARHAWHNVLPLLGAGRFVGREEDLRALHAALIEDAPPVQLRAVGLVGLPGVGKTELLKQLVHDPAIAAHFSGGVLWASLGRDPDVTVQLHTWARALGIDDARLFAIRGTLDLARMLHSVIAERRMLFVLDDVWQAADAYALRIGGIHSAVVFATRFPEVAASLAGASIVRLGELSEDASLELLGAFAPEVLAQHADVCRTLAVQLGGLPLALVLAGQYLQEAAFTGQPRRAQDALNRLQQSLFRYSLSDKSAVLDGAEPIQRTLSAVISETLEALSPPARRALPGLGTLAHKPHTLTESTILEVCQTSTGVCDELVNYGVIELAGDDRYALHQSIADYLRDHLTERQDWARMITHYADFVDRNHADFERLKPEFQNALAAAHRARRNGHAGELVRLTLGLYAYLDAQQLWSLAATLLGACATSEHVRERPDLLLDVTQKQATALLHLGRVDEASSQGWRLLRLAGRAQDRRAMALAYDVLAQVALARDDAAGATVLGRHAVDVAAEQGDRHLLRMTRGTLAVCLAVCGDATASELMALDTDADADADAEPGAPALDASHQTREHMFRNRTVLASTQLLAGHFAQAEASARQALALAETLERADLVVQSQALIAWVMHFRGRLIEARDLASAVLDEYDDADACAAIHHVLGCVAWCRGEFALAESYFAAAVSRDGAAPEAGVVSRAAILAMLGRARASQGNVAAARAALTESLAHCKLRVERILPLVELSLVAAREGRLDEALAHVQEAHTLREMLGLFDGPYFASVVSARSGEIRLLAGDARGAHDDYLRARAHAQRMAAPELIGTAEFGLAQALAALKDVAEASAYAKRAYERLQSIGHHKARLARDFDAYLGARPGVKQARNTIAHE